MIGESVYQNDSYLQYFISYFRKLEPGPVGWILSLDSEVWKSSEVQDVILDIHLVALLKASTLGRALRRNKHPPACSFICPIFWVFFSCASPPHARLLQSPIHASDVPSEVLDGESLAPFPKPRADRKRVESAAWSPGVVYSSNRTSDWDSVQRTGSETVCKFLIKTLLSAGHRLGQQLLHSIFHHIWPFLWNFWNSTAHIFGQVRTFPYFYNLFYHNYL